MLHLQLCWYQIELDSGGIDILVLSDVVRAETLASLDPREEQT